MSAGLSDDVSELVCSSIFSVFLSDTLLSGNIIAGLVSEAACGKPLASVAGEVTSVDSDGCAGVDVGSGCSVGRVVVDGFSRGSLRDSSGLDSGADDCAGDSELEIDGDETGDEVVLNDGIGSSVSLDAGFGSGFVIEIGTAADTGVVLVVGGSVGIGASDGVDDRVASTETDGLFISGVGDGDIAAEAGDGDWDGDVESDEATSADTGVGIDGDEAVDDDGVSGLIVRGGIGVDGAAAGEDGVDETEVTDVASEEGMGVDGNGCSGVDVGSGCSVGRVVVGTPALGVVDNDTVGDAAG